MKKIIIISLTVIGLGFVSCQKETITQNSTDSTEVPVWEESARLGGEDTPEGDDDDDDVKIIDITDPNEDQDGPPITDPNEDQD